MQPKGELGQQKGWVEVVHPQEVFGTVISVISDKASSLLLLAAGPSRGSRANLNSEMARPVGCLRFGVGCAVLPLAPFSAGLH